MKKQKRAEINAFFEMYKKEKGDKMNNIQENISRIVKSQVSEIDKIFFEYMKIKNISFEDLSKNMFMKDEYNYETNTSKKTYWYKKDLVVKIIQTIKTDMEKPYEATISMIIEKGDWIK
jgi:hypothetical protein